MSYLSTGVGPSPFLTTSRHHFHTQNFSSSPRHHYGTNSFTNGSAYLTPFFSEQYYGEEKYFKKETRNIFPSISRIESVQQEKIINPLNTYSGDLFGTCRVTSPFERGQIYYGNKDPKIFQSSSRSIIDQLESSSYRGKKENPFNKKYLLSEKNQQLENYAMYSTSPASYQLSESIPPKKKRSRSPRRFSTQKRDQLYQQDMTDQVLRMATQYDRVQQRGQPRQKYHKYNSSKNLNIVNQLNYQSSGQQLIRSEKQQQYMVESQVDEKQFNSFGKGKQLNRQNAKYQKVDQAESLIMGLAKIASAQSKTDKYQQPDSKTKKYPVFIDSDHDQRESGTFKVPEAIIEEINNPRIPSTIFRKERKQSATPFSIERSVQLSQRGERQKEKVKKQEKTQVSKKIPNTINLRGKTYEKLTL